MKKILFAVAFVLLANNLAAQTNCSCCSEPNKQFDFWVGHWTVKNPQGTIVGENQISKIEDNCVLQEKWTGSKGSTGTSMNYYDTTDNTWNQLWVDNKGSVLKLKGGFSSGKMILKSDLIKGKKVALYYNQITWTKNDDGTVTQLWEIYDNEHKLLQTLFTGIYYQKE